LRSIETKYHSLIEEEIRTQLSFEPEVETRNRKPLRRPMTFGGQWELRLGPDNRFRVIYEVDADESRVRILAIGVRDRNRLLFGGKEYLE